MKQTQSIVCKKQIAAFAETASLVCCESDTVYEDASGCRNSQSEAANNSAAVRDYFQSRLAVNATWLRAITEAIRYFIYKQAQLYTRSI